MIRSSAAEADECLSLGCLHLEVLDTITTFQFYFLIPLYYDEVFFLLNSNNFSYFLLCL